MAREEIRSKIVRSFFSLLLIAPGFIEAGGQASALMSTLSFFVPVAEAADTPDLVKPKAAFDSTSFDWGTVNQGTKVVRDFTLKNAGGAELVIQRINPSCGCTATSTIADRIPPGGETKVHVEIDTSDFSGAKERSVRLFTNDPDDPMSVLTLKGIIEPSIAIEPPRLSFPSIVRSEVKEPPSMSFVVKVRPGSAATIKSVTSRSKFISINDSGGEKERKVTVTLDPKMPNGEFRDRVEVELAGAPTNTVNVPVIAPIKGQVQLRPSTLSFGVIEGAAVLTKHVRFETAGTQPVNIKSVRSDSDAVSAQFKLVKPGKIFDIQVDVDPRKVSKDLRASLTVETDSPTEGTLTIAVNGILPPKS